MAQEEQRYSSGSRSWKKQKQKKIPQRGLGVAQLEKIRLEEQQKKHAMISIPFSMLSSEELPLSLPNPVFNTSDPVPILEVPNPPPPLHYAYDSSSQVESGYGHRFFPNSTDSLSHHTHNTRKLKTAVQYRLNSQIEANPVWNLSDFPQTNQQTLQQQQQQQDSSLANVSSSTLSSLSVINLEMEPPSNQSYCSNSTLPAQHKEERMVGMKRPHQFVRDGAPGDVPFQCKFLPLMPFHGWDESFNGLAFKFHSQNSLLRESPLSSAAVHTVDDLHLPAKTIKENGALDGGFLTLGPPTTSSNPKSKQPVPIPAAHFGQFDVDTFQQSMEEEALSGLDGREKQEQPFYSFLEMKPNGPLAALKDLRGGDDNVDLNLKL